jgi:DNA-binding LytR/AlgR family response regulator
MKKDYSKNHEDNPGILIQTRQYASLVYFRDIEYVEVFNHHVFFHLASGKDCVAPGPFYSWALKLLADERFALCHGSIIVNLDYVASVEKTTATLKSGGKLPIARRCRDFRNQFVSYMAKSVSIQASQ